MTLHHITKSRILNIFEYLVYFFTKKIISMVIVPLAVQETYPVYKHWMFKTQLDMSSCIF